ncbi:MAG: WYL domain-containing protein [Oscillospiraceae bacterium]|nr:WYL domain-containing protein [Oscillospiraceae bacterium]
MESFDAGALSRYDMSDSTYRQLQRDHIRFEEECAEKFSNGFICRILINYMCYAQENFLKRFESDIEKAFVNTEHDQYKKDDRISFTKQLTEKIAEFDFSTNTSFKKRVVITYLLEQFTQLPLSEREIVYCYHQYTSIKQAMDKKELLIVKQLTGKEYEVKPFDIRIDENTLSYYLIGYSRLKGSIGDFESHSFKLSRIKECRSKHKEARLSYTEIKTIKEINDKFGSAYIARNLVKKDIEKTIVRLTKKGYENLYLKTISHQRPVPITLPKQIVLNGEEYFELTFDCSFQHIRNYFFSFGAEAEVISPLWLRELFMNDYRKALEIYHGD